MERSIKRSLDWLTGRKKLCVAAACQYRCWWWCCWAKRGECCHGLLWCLRLHYAAVMSEPLSLEIAAWRHSGIEIAMTTTSITATVSMWAKLCSGVASAEARACLRAIWPIVFNGVQRLETGHAPVSLSPSLSLSGWAQSSHKWALKCEPKVCQS